MFRPVGFCLTYSLSKIPARSVPFVRRWVFGWQQLLPAGHLNELKTLRARRKGFISGVN
jgi:hypothetical protein